MEPKTIFITGGAGYVGQMLVEQFSKRLDVAKVVALDKEPMPESFQGNTKIVWISANTSDGTWQEKVKAENPEVVVHTAWQIRELYGNRPLSWKWNIDGSDAIFDFAFTHPSVKKLIHFSTVASYGAFADNTLEHRFTEDEPFRETEYLYAEEKRISEEHLKARYQKYATSGRIPQVFIIRPAAITGPRGRFARIRFGLQSALSGSLKGQRSFVYSLVSLLVSWVPVTPKWLRQYIHEDDITDIVALFSFTELPGAYEAFNAAPPGPAVLGPDMAKAVGKRMLPIKPWMARIAFFCFWHLTRGGIPTSKGSWRGYSYPINVDGTKISKMYEYVYAYESGDAFQYTNGRYGDVVPAELRKHKA